MRSLGYLTGETGSLQNVGEGAVDLKNQIVGFFTDEAMWMNILTSGIRVIIIFILTRLVIRVVYKMIDQFLLKQEKSRIQVNSRRFVTVGELLKNVTSVVCNFVMILIILSEFNFKLGPLLAGAGVLGLAIGFGAQSLVKDVITGFFIIFEDQFAVGDVIKSGEYRGTVEMIGLRTSRVRGLNGETYIIPNGMITSVTNYSLSNSLAIVDLPVKNDQQLKDTVTLIQTALEGITERRPEVQRTPDVLGIQTLNTSEYVVRIVAECNPNAREAVERQIFTDIKQAIEAREMGQERAQG
ncbi:MscS Mechanosensitive ion channel [Paenibacillus vortex V453]|uniref:MscS Mechanosensitive ion channel n=1 Tax=Paenibacillus vortex V453 TaxID=715225 RepID=A0A2R9T2T2_9BACL|nr:mechanosensitive ion channel family protein [Paenibacillus sp. LBL]EFU43943.1 MscS Mechanosensitive ion channel [Paenibacillus vortex V453]MDH6673634.1 small-conductance mechanosensitive channel [Paenibacillus sp. LBL]OMF79387.1 mechanosensitive ion channel protein MscS [Paenibacillus glucanolyticus]